MAKTAIEIVGMFGQIVKEVEGFLSLSKWERDYIAYSLSSGQLGCIVRHYPGEVDDGGESDDWWVQLDTLAVGGYSDKDRGEAETVAKFISGLDVYKELIMAS